MIKKRGTGDLKVIYRPYRIDEVVGNEHIKKIVSNGLINGTLPHASLFTGPRGCGKTTFARIIALALNCEEGISPNPCGVCDTCRSIIRLSNTAVLEIDSVAVGNKAYIREVADNFSSGTLTGERAKVIIIDEAHKLTNDGEDILLKPMEDTPDHVYVILCTNHPEKLKDATRDRCRAGTIQFGRIESRYLVELLEQVAQFEGMNYKKDIIRYIAENAEGTPRTALGILQQVNNEESWSMEAAKVICDVGVDVDAAVVFDFCKVLIKGQWKSTISAFNNIKNIPPESTRIAIMGYMTGCLRNAKSSSEALKFSKIIDVISAPYYAPKAEHILFNSCFKINELINGRI